MSLLETTTSPATGRAGMEAERNRVENLRAMAQAQPALAIALAVRAPEVRWVYGRDGALTARTASEEWLTGCSLPWRTAQALLGRPQVTGTTACFLSPSHAAQLRVALDLLRQDQAILAIVPDLDALATMIHCCDFSTDIAARRLWFAGGSEWVGELKLMLADNPGLPTPVQFLRTALLNADEAGRLIPLAERALAEVSAERSRAVEQLLQRPRGSAATPRVCLLGSSRFRLWEHAAGTLLGIAQDLAARNTIKLDHLNPERPDRTAPLGLAMAAAEAQVILTANVGRADLPRVVPPDVAVIAWLTLPRIPARDGLAKHDALVLADKAWTPAALSAGWPAERIFIGGWPSCPELRAADAPPHLAIIADTLDASPDRQRFDLSSHCLLWEAIHHELTTTPLALSADIGGYLRARMERMGIQPEGLDTRRFVEELIIPAYQQGLAQLLILGGLAVRLHGRGWGILPRFQAHAAGEIDSHDRLLAAAQSAAGLVHVWPFGGVHPIDALRRPVVRAGRNLLDQARQALAGNPGPAPAISELTATILEDVIGRCMVAKS